MKKIYSNVGPVSVIKLNSHLRLCLYILGGASNYKPVEPVEPDDGLCRSRRDVLILMETRMAFSDAQMDKFRDIAVGIASRMYVDKTHVRVALAEYSKTVKSLIDLDTANSTADLVKRVKAADLKPFISSMLNLAIGHAQGVFQNTAQDVPKVVVVLTGGSAARPSSARLEIKSILTDPTVSILGVGLKKWVGTTGRQNSLSALLVGETENDPGTPQTRKNIMVFDPPGGEGSDDEYEKKFLDQLAKKICDA